MVAVSYASNFRSGESPVGVQHVKLHEMNRKIKYLPYRQELASENSWN